MNDTSNPSETKVTLADVRRVAELANLELSSDEETLMLRDLNAILGNVAELNELDTATVPAMAQVSDVIANGANQAAALRPDVVVPSLDRRRVLAASPDTDGIFFKVPKVIER